MTDAGAATRLAPAGLSAAGVAARRPIVVMRGVAPRRVVVRESPKEGAVVDRPRIPPTPAEADVERSAPVAMRVAIHLEVVAIFLSGLFFFAEGLSIVNHFVHFFRRRLDSLRVRPVLRLRLPFTAQDDPLPDDDLDQGVRAA